MSALSLTSVYVSTVPRVNPLPRRVYLRLTAPSDPCCQRSEVNEEESMLLHLQTEENKPKCETNLLLQGFTFFLLERGHVYPGLWSSSAESCERFCEADIISLVKVKLVQHWYPTILNRERIYRLKWKKVCFILEAETHFSSGTDAFIQSAVYI